MEKSLKLSLSLILICCLSCNIEYLSKEQREKRAEFKWGEFLDAHGYRQGSPANMKALEEILKLNPNQCDAIRELSIPYLKRGMPEEWKSIYDRAVECDAALWQPWRGYLYLYFYRDYEKAIADFNASDSLTPNHIDSPQGHSVDYWRGHAYLGAKDYDNSIRYYQKHIAHVTAEWGEDWLEPDAFLNLGIAFYEKKAFDKVSEQLDKALHHYQEKSADTKYYYALLEQEKGNHDRALIWVGAAIEDFLQGNSKKRPYNEEIRQVYLEQLIELEKELKKPHQKAGFVN